MATPKEVEQFLDAYTSAWEANRDWSRKIFHPGGGVRYPGSDQLVNPDTPPSMTDLMRAVASDLRVRLVAWAERDNILFAEWELTCTLGGRALKLVAVNRFRLEGNRALEATAFVDRMNLVEFLDPAREPVTLRDLLARAVIQSRESGA
jgi:hypothetical protein